MNTPTKPLPNVGIVRLACEQVLFKIRSVKRCGKYKNVLVLVYFNNIMNNCTELSSLSYFELLFWEHLLITV